MLFHIKHNGPAMHTRCGVLVEEVYRSLTDHLTTEAAVQNRTDWYASDAVCLACVRKVRPSTPKQLRACRDIPAGTWVVLCSCGGVRPHASPCGKSQPLPLDRP